MTLDCNKDEEEKIKKILGDVLIALNSKRYFIHVSRLIEEKTNIFNSECLMQNTITLKQMSLIDVIKVQKFIDQGILENGVSIDGED